MVAVQDLPQTEERMQMEEYGHLLLPNLKKLGWGWGMGCQVIGKISWIREKLIINMLT